MPYPRRRRRRVLEERMSGREMSASSRSADGRAMVPIAAACDYKRAGDGDPGPNTGGMGAYSPPPAFPTTCFETVRERIIAPVLRGLLAEDEDLPRRPVLRADVDRERSVAWSSSTRASAIPRRK